jgi:hypothetical protein
MPWDAVEDTITIARWHAYEAEWLEHPTVDDLTAWRYEYKPPGVHKEAKDATVMGPADFARFVRATGGKKMGPNG